MTAAAAGPVSTVVIRLDGPMQAWSRANRTHGGGGRRPTQDHPTKTGVIGLIANALGRDRTDPIDDLTVLTYAARADRSGTLEVDYHTAGGGDYPLLPTEVNFTPSLTRAAKKLPDGTRPTRGLLGADYGAPKSVTQTPGQPTAPTGNRPTVLSQDHYLADAAFTAALTGNSGVIHTIADALQRPARHLYLGRRSYPPTGPTLIGVTDHTDPVDALLATPTADRADPGPRPIWSETIPGPAVPDQPLNYATRIVGPRREGRSTTQTATPTTTAADRIDYFTAPHEDHR